MKRSGPSDLERVRRQDFVLVIGQNDQIEFVWRVRTLKEFSE